jgi:FGGY-family pentulose kinase
VAVDVKTHHPVSVSPNGEKDHDIILWADHRATPQANIINDSKTSTWNSINHVAKHYVLNFVGGTISPEMETPKLLWIKEHLPDLYNNQNVHFFDLADYLVYRCTGVLDVRSQCTTVCKWTYDSHAIQNNQSDERGWDRSYFEQIGLQALLDDNRIGTRIRPMGEAVGSGLVQEAAESMKLNVNTPVSVGAIDAHAGGIGVVGAPLPNQDRINMSDRIVIIAGTSSCHMAATPSEVFVEGVWGPYHSAMVPGMWLSEGGQSAVGKLIDHVVESHAYSNTLQSMAQEQNKHAYEILNETLEQMAGNGSVTALARDLHVLPYFHGNRSPLADPSLRGIMSGLTISNTLQDLALVYLSTIQAISYGTKHIIGRINKSRERVMVDAVLIRNIIICGGLAKNKLFVQMHADVTQCPVYIPRESEAMIVGSAILGAVAGKVHETVNEAMKHMNVIEHMIEPNRKDFGFHNKKYRVYLEMYKDQLKYRAIMKDAELL